MPMQYTEIFKVVKNEKKKKISRILYYVYFFLIFAQNIDFGYTLELPCRGGSNEYSLSMFWNKIRKIGIPLQTQILQ